MVLRVCAHGGEINLRLDPEAAEDIWVADT